MFFQFGHFFLQGGKVFFGDHPHSLASFLDLITGHFFYFLLIRPQQKRNKEHKEMISNLKKGDRIITSGGIYGRVTGLDDTTLTVEIADRVRVKVVRGNVSALAQTNATPPPAKKEKDKSSTDKS